MFSKVHTTISSSEFRADLARSLGKAKKTPLVVTTGRGSDAYVVLGSELYNKLVAAREDDVDSRRLQTLIKKEKNAKRVSWRSLKT